MPEFFPEHTPSGLDEFTTGYLEAVEWLLPEETDSEGNIIGPPPYDKLTGFERKTLARIKRDCRQFPKDNRELLAQFCEITGRGMDSAGHDFFLTRNRHGAGFWDRGARQVGEDLSTAAHGYGSTYEFLTRRGRLVSE